MTAVNFPQRSFVSMYSPHLIHFVVVSFLLLVSGKRDGQGMMVYSNGDMYQGAWAEGERSGIGILTCENKDRYEGTTYLSRKQSLK